MDNLSRHFRHAQGISIAIILLVVLLFLALAGMSFDSENDLAGNLFLTCIALFVVYIALTSIYTLRADQMLVAMLFGTEFGVYINGNVAEEKDEPHISPESLLTKRERENQRLTLEERGGKRGIFRLDIIILFYPLFTAHKLPTEPIEVEIPESGVYEKGTNLPFLIDSTLYVEFSPNVGILFSKFPQIADYYDLTKECEYHDKIWKTIPPNEEARRGAHTFKGPRIAAILLDQLENPLRDAFNVVVPQHFRFSGPSVQPDETYNILSNSQELERRCWEYLGNRGSPLQSARLVGKLNYEDDGPAYIEEYRQLSAIRCDLRVERYRLENEDAQKSLSATTVARNNAKAAKIDGKGLAAKSKEIATALKTPEGRAAYSGEVITKTQGNVTIVGVDQSPLETILGQRRQERRKRKGP